MAYILLSKTAFTKGQVSPLMYSRVDVKEYGDALKEATNTMIYPQGAVARRNGTKFINEVKDSTKATILIGFDITADESYILEVGHNYIRIYNDGARVESGGSPVEITTTYTSTEISSLSFVPYANTLRIAHPDHPPALLRRGTDSTDWSLETLVFSPEPTDTLGEDIAASLTLSAVSGSGVTCTASAASFVAADVGRQLTDTAGNGRGSIVGYTSSTVVTIDVLDTFDSTSVGAGDGHLDLSPVCALEPDGSAVGSIITVRSVYDSTDYGEEFTITNVTNAAAGVVTTSTSATFSDGDRVVIDDVAGMTQLNGNVYTVKGIVTTTFTLADDNNNNLDTTGYTAYSSGGIVYEQLEGQFIGAFRSGDVGRYIRLHNGVLLITEYVSESEVKCEVLKSLDSLAVTKVWSIEDPVWTASRGYPRAVGLHQNRAFYGGTETEPQTVWGSETGIFEGFGRGANAADSLHLPLTAENASRVNWLSSGRSLIVGTDRGEFTIEANNNGSLKPDDAGAFSQTPHGSKTQSVTKIGNETLFVQASTQKIRSFRYSFQDDAYVGDNLFWIARELGQKGIVTMAYSREPDSQLYAVTSDGDMLVAAYDRKKQVAGWSVWSTDGSFEWVATIRNNNKDEIWVVVKRTINGTEKRYIELLDTGNGEDRLDGYSDCYLTYSDPKTISGITQANPGVVTTSAAHGYSNGDSVKLLDVGGMTEVINTTYVVANSTSTTFELTDLDGNNVNTTGFTAFTSGGESHKLITSVGGLTHLEGATVQIKADGAYHADKTVSSGSITLDHGCYELVVGLPYTMTIELLEMEYNLGKGSQQGQPTRAVGPILRLYKSVHPQVNGKLRPMMSGKQVMDKALPLVTGDVVYGPYSYSEGSNLIITEDRPFPVVITGIFGSYEGGMR